MLICLKVPAPVFTSTRLKLSTSIYSNSARLLKKNLGQFGQPTMTKIFKVLDITSDSEKNWQWIKLSFSTLLRTQQIFGDIYLYNWR